MGNLISRFKNLEIFVISRRDHQYAVHHSESTHPERLSPDELTTVENIEQKSESPSVSITTTEPVASPIRCSDFYLACRHNKIEKVKELLKTITLDEIDQLEPNGSSALHAACYHGHKEIVELLLKAGADRAVPNKYNCLPFDEAKNHEIKKLFFRVPNTNRHISNTGAIEWDLIDDDALENAAQERQNIKSIFDNNTGTTPIDKMFEKIEKSYISKGLTHFDGIDNIRRFFDKATKEQDPIWIIKAYTAETDFYKILNKELAGGASKYQNERKYIIALLKYHPKLDHLSYIGTCYRVMQMNDDDLEKYQVNCSLMTKAFLSSSIDQKVAAWFLSQQKLTNIQCDQAERHNAHGKVIKQWIMCVYNIKHHRTALHIENSSQYVNEGEVLIMPYTVFQVKNIRQVKTSYLSDDLSIIEIELEECDDYLNAEK
jgi:hypothetical protein